MVIVAPVQYRRWSGERPASYRAGAMPYSGHPWMFSVRKLMKGFEGLTVLRRVAFAAMALAACPPPQA